VFDFSTLKTFFFINFLKYKVKKKKKKKKEKKRRGGGGGRRL